MSDLHMIANAGSATYKYAFFDKQKKLFSVRYEKKSKIKYERILIYSGKEKKKKISERVFENSLQDVLELKEYKILEEKNTFKKIGFRFVHGANLFRQPKTINKSFLKKLKKLDELAPLHNPYARRLIKDAFDLLPRIKKIIVCDTGFHQTIPEVHWRYPLPKKMSDSQYIRRYGFHGIVCSSIVYQLRKIKRLKKHSIICHLGSGCSVTAIKNGKSINTSMGFTPLEGLMMSTRAGDIDPGVMLHLQKKKFSQKRLDKILNEQSGLRGISGEQDMRKILTLSSSGNKNATLALEMFTMSAAQHIAKIMISLGSVDQIIFSGGIGENSDKVRKMICKKLDCLQVKIDSKKNRAAKAGQSFRKQFSKIDLIWMHADEQSEINRIISKM